MGYKTYLSRIICFRRGELRPLVLFSLIDKAFPNMAKQKTVSDTTGGVQRKPNGRGILTKEQPLNGWGIGATVFVLHSRSWT